jgi:putative alpha-1,2-mannosidase
VTLNFENGKRLIIDAPGNSKENIYAGNIRLNKKELKRNYIRHSELQAGGRLQFKMQSVPDKSRNTTEAAYPYSMSTKNKK